MYKLRVLLCFLSLFLFCGCSIRTDLYIQNLTENNLKITIKYKNSIIDRIDENYELTFNFVNGVVPPKSFEDEINLQSLDKTIINDSTIVVELPKLSTVRIEKSTNNMWLHYSIDYIEIKEKQIFAEEIKSKSVKIKSDYVYKIKK